MTIKLNNVCISLVIVKRLFVAMALISAVLAPLTAIARDGQDLSASLGRYIIELQNPPLAAAATRKAGERRLKTRSPEAVAYLEFIAMRHEEFTQEASLLLRRAVTPVHRYRIVTNGMAVDLSEGEAAILAESPLVKSISKDRIRRLETFAGPKWIGAGQIWSGQSGFSAAAGENIIVGILDSGINWDSPSFDDPTLDGYAHTNPLGETLGLCDLPEVRCNNKLIGVYDYVTDNPSTDEVEESTNGKDISGHGSHVASIAAGNPVSIPVPGKGNQTLSGVAPRANLITYRICHISGCFESITIAAIEQAVEDQVDVLNYSIGGVDNWLTSQCALDGGSRLCHSQRRRWQRCDEPGWW